MRRLYTDLLWRRLRRGDLAFPLRAARGLWAAWRGQPRPLLGTLIVTYRCDLACGMCDLPTRGERGRELDAGGLRGVLDAFFDLGVLGVGVTGGEPMLRPDLHDLLRHGSDRGLLMHLNTNGSLVRAETASRLSDDGVASVNVSLDAPDAETHDRLRGRRGSYDRVVRAVARLCAGRRRSYRVALTCAVGAANVGSARRLLDRARDLGVDRVGFLPVHDFPANRVSGVAPPAQGGGDPLFPLEALRDDPLVDNSRAYLDLFGPAFAGARNPVPCAAPRTSIVVDCYGEVFPCVPLNAAREPVGRGDIRELWRSETYRRVRERLAGCRACFWNCHTEMNLALGRLGANGRTDRVAAAATSGSGLS